MRNPQLEQSLVLIKPDALRNSLTGYVLSLLSEFHTGLRFAAAKIVCVSRMIAEEHYAEHRGKYFFPPLIDYILGAAHWPDEPWKRRVIALVYQGPGAVAKIRDLCGPTDPHVAREQRPGCVRALGTTVPVHDAEGKLICNRLDNLIHASADDTEAEREIKLWFKPNDIPPLMRPYETSIAEIFYYYKDGRLYKGRQTGAVCLLAPGDVAWKSDLEAINAIYDGGGATISAAAVAAKYLINEGQENR